MLTPLEIILLSVISSGVFLYFFKRYYVKYTHQKRIKKGLKGEKEAKVLLKKNGYKILSEQLEDKVTLSIDEKHYDCKIRADFYVKKGYKRYIVEVKTGTKARPTVPEIRRQLLEYDLVFRPSGLLFIDMKKGSIEKIKFHKKLKRYDFFDKLMYFGIGIVFGFICAIALLKSII